MHEGPGRRLGMPDPETSPLFHAMVAAGSIAARRRDGGVAVPVTGLFRHTPVHCPEPSQTPPAEKGVFTGLPDDLREDRTTLGVNAAIGEGPVCRDADPNAGALVQRAGNFKSCARSLGEIGHQT